MCTWMIPACLQARWQAPSTNDAEIICLAVAQVLLDCPGDRRFWISRPRDLPTFSRNDRRIPGTTSACGDSRQRSRERCSCSRSTRPARTASYGSWTSPRFPARRAAKRSNEAHLRATQRTDTAPRTRATSGASAPGSCSRRWLDGVCRRGYVRLSRENRCC